MHTFASTFVHVKCYQYKFGTLLYNLYIFKFPIFYIDKIIYKSIQVIFLQNAEIKTGINNLWHFNQASL